MGGTEDTGVEELGPVDYLVVEFPPAGELQRRDGGRTGRWSMPERSACSTC